MKLGEYIDDYGIKVYSFSNDIDDEEARIIFEKWLKRTRLFKGKTKRRLLFYKIAISFYYSKLIYLLSFIALSLAPKVYFNIGGVIIVVKITTITIAVK